MANGDASATTETVNARISSAVRLLLTRSGLTQQDLAHHLGIPPPSLTRSIRRDSTRPRKWGADEVWQMALFFNVPTDFFYEAGISEERIQKEWDETMERVKQRLSSE